jgi:hypothetical protein
LPVSDGDTSCWYDASWRIEAGHFKRLRGVAKISEAWRKSGGGCHVYCFRVKGNDLIYAEVAVLRNVQ